MLHMDTAPSAVQCVSLERIRIVNYQHALHLNVKFLSLKFISVKLKQCLLYF